MTNERQDELGKLIGETIAAFGGFTSYPIDPTKLEIMGKIAEYIDSHFLDKQELEKKIDEELKIVEYPEKMKEVGCKQAFIAGQMNMYLRVKDIYLKLIKE